MTAIIQVKPSISTSFIKTFFVQSKEAIRLAMADLEDTSLGTSDNSYIYHEGDLESDYHTQRMISRLSCWKFLFRKRQSRILVGD